jgi:uncharacterized membrane protein HdeD (DUF308 family)
VIILGVILLLLAYLVPGQPEPLYTIEYVLGWILVVVGIILFALSLGGRSVGGRRYWF